MGIDSASEVGDNLASTEQAGGGGVHRSGEGARRVTAGADHRRMKRAITLVEAGRMLRARADVALGDRALRAAVEKGELVRVRRGWYVDAVEWADVWAEGRHLVEVLATPSQRAIQTWSGSANASGRWTRASSSALMPEPAEE